ncbi:PAS domain-containing protein [Rhodoferax sp. GW822-FHT02A01]|uniref:sensor histidine kinase n=1 Tax=Rhodoferax sp. GW822-FHT02A01 TaxID=3141537 RepID=UPI00315CB7FA
MGIGSDEDSSAAPQKPDLDALDVRQADRQERRAIVSPLTSRQLVHELRVHQIELELQNEELRRMQIELAAARSRYFDLYDLAPVGYCTLSEAEIILEANLTGGSLLGLSRDALVGKRFQNFIWAADQDIYYLHRKKLFDTGLPQSCEVRLLRAGGSTFWSLLRSTFDSGSTTKALHRLVLTDVNERKLEQDHIRISDIALKAVSQGVLIASPELQVVSANQAFLTMTGYSEPELIGASCSIFNGPLTNPDTQCAFMQAIQAQRDFSGEFVNYRKDGSHFWNQLVVSPVRDGQGRLTHFISINTDVSVRKELDRVLLEKNLELQRTTALAERANQAKSDFLSSMSHELRTPLNSILGFAQLLESGTPELTTLQQRNIQMVLRGGWYLLALINEILDLSSIESGKLALSLEPVAISQVLADCQSLIAPQAERSGIQVNFPVLSDSLVATADPLRLKQVIVNLLSNAIKYNRVNGVVDVTVSSDAQQTLCIRVQDMGEGLSEEKMSQLFQPFNRLGQESKGTEGTGIGLVLTRRLTELMGGRVGVQSTMGVGSVFWIELRVPQG